MKKNILTFLIFAFITFLFIYKLDFPYFFTDEILYTTAGYEYMHGNFTRNLQHPLIGKYIVGLVSLISQNNVFILRLPYALLGVASSFVVYLILKKQFGVKFGILGSLLYVLSPFLYVTTRMVMFESPLHFFWLLFNYYFLLLLENIDKPKKNHYLLVGVFLGLSIATKIPSLVLYAFIPLIYIFVLVSKNKKINVSELVKNISSIYFVSIVVYGITYLPLLMFSGFSNLITVAKETLKIFLGRNTEGKNHVINGVVYNKSPWWSYLYFINKEYSIPHLLLMYLSPLLILVKRNLFVVYWMFFLGLNILFFQLIPLKNSRYIASIEISLIFLATSLLYYVWELLKHRSLMSSVLLILLVMMLSFIFIDRTYKVLTQPYTEYNWVFNYFKNETNNFSQYKRMYVFGSIRSLKWYRTFVPDESMFLYRQDYDIMCNEFGTFDYIAFEGEELLMDPSNLLMKFVNQNINGFQKIDIPNFTIYKKLPAFVSSFDCSSSIK